MRTAPMTAARALLVAALAALLVIAMAGPAAGAQEHARGGHALAKKLPKKWVKAHGLKGADARPLADPDRDGALNWVEFRQRTNPRKPNAVTTTPPTTDVPASRIILLEGTVQAVTPTGFTVALESGLLVNVSLSPTTPVVDRQGIVATLAAGQELHAFVSQTSDLALGAVLVFVDDPADPGQDPVAGDGEDDDDGHHRGDDGDPGKRC